MKPGERGDTHMSRHVCTVQPLAGSSRRPRAPVRPRAIRSQVISRHGLGSRVSVSRESRLTSLPPLSWHMNGALRAKSYIRVQLRLARHGHGPTRCMDLAHHTRCITESRWSAGHSAQAAPRHAATAAQTPMRRGDQAASDVPPPPPPPAPANRPLASVRRGGAVSAAVTAVSAARALSLAPTAASHRRTQFQRPRHLRAPARRTVNDCQPEYRSQFPVRPGAIDKQGPSWKTPRKSPITP